MNKYAILIFALLLASLAITVSIELRYSQATLVFGLFAVVLAPIAVHRTTSPGTALGFLMTLSFYASFPLKKLFQIDELPFDILITLLYCGSLWIVAAGWKRNWAFR